MGSVPLASCVLWKCCLGNFGEIPRKLFSTKRILKAHNYAEYELSCWCFSRNFSKIFRTSIKENLPMDVPYFIKEHLWRKAEVFFTEVNPNKMIAQLWLLWWFSKLWKTEKLVTDKCFEKIYTLNPNYLTLLEMYVKELAGCFRLRLSPDAQNRAFGKNGSCIQIIDTTLI